MTVSTYGILTVCASVRRNTKPEVRSIARAREGYTFDRGLCILRTDAQTVSIPFITWPKLIPLKNKFLSENYNFKSDNRCYTGREFPFYRFDMLFMFVNLLWYEIDNYSNCLKLKLLKRRLKKKRKKRKEVWQINVNTSKKKIEAALKLPFLAGIIAI